MGLNQFINSFGERVFVLVGGIVICKTFELFSAPSAVCGWNYSFWVDGGARVLRGFPCVRCTNA